MNHTIRSSLLIALLAVLVPLGIKRLCSRSARRIKLSLENDARQNGVAKLSNGTKLRRRSRTDISHMTQLEVWESEGGRCRPIKRLENSVQ